MNTYRLTDAVALVAKHGYAFLAMRGDALEENRIVSIAQDWTPPGQEFCDFRLARGKYGPTVKNGIRHRGQSIGRAYREDPQSFRDRQKAPQ